MSAALSPLLPSVGIDAERVTLVCIPHAGGGTSQFYRWQRFAPDWLQVVPLKLPGREDRLREAAYDQLEMLIDDVAAAIEQSRPPRLALLGHSMGTYVALEVTRLLIARGEHLPALLTVAGASAPQFVANRNPLSRLDDDAFVAEISRRYDGLPEAVLADRQLLSLVLPALRADIALVESYKYVPSAPLPCDMLAIGGLDDPGVPYTRLAGWAEHAAGQFTLRQFPGGHFFLHPESRRAGGSAEPPAAVATVFATLADIFDEGV